MEPSILVSTKKILGVDKDYVVFDLDISTHINSVFSDLNQLGIGPVEGFMIEDAETVWSDFLGTDPRLNNVKTYVFLRVRMVFDPPVSGYAITAMKEQIKELEWRLSAARDDRILETPSPLPVTEPTVPLDVVDGGTPTPPQEFLLDSGTP